MWIREDLVTIPALCLLVLLSTQGVLSQKSVCKGQSTACKCETDKGLVDLTPLDKTDGSPRFTEIAKDGSGTYMYNPCTPFTSGPTGSSCTGVLGCQTTGSTYYPLAKADTAKWAMSGGKLKILYYAIDSVSANRSMEVTLVCDENIDREFQPSGDSVKSLTYPMTLTSKYACPKASPTPSGGLSTGSVLCIILVVLVVVYLVGGGLYMYFVKGARGLEIIPNIDFWKEFPSYVKDGVLFVVQKIKGTPAAEYQNI